MQKFHQQLLAQSEAIWKKILNHRFLKLTTDGSIPDDTFKAWMRQDYIFVREAIPFVALLLAKAPIQLRSNFIDIISGLNTELKMFRKNAEAHGVNLEHVIPSPTCHAYIQFLMNIAYNGSFEEGFTALYAGEKVYFDSWMEVKRNQKNQSPWQEFINNWTSEGFSGYVDWLAVTLDELAQGKPERDLKKMEEIFLLIARYEYLFWEMAATAEAWPV